MTRALLSTAILVTVAACGGKSTPAQATPTATVALVDGNHMCRFIIDGQPWNEHRCEVADGSLRKLSGWEQFDASLTAQGDALVVDGKGGSDADRSTPFRMTLTRDGGSWKGTVVPDGPTDWWPANAVFEIIDAAGYGGDAYGGDAYGGE